MHHEVLWQSFLASNDARWKLAIHTRDPLVLATRVSEPFRSAIIPDSKKASWCRLHEPMFRLLEEGLKDERVRKLVFNSADSVPVKSFDTIYRTLVIDSCETCSLFCADLQEETAELWSVLSRKHAEILVSHKDMLWKAFRNVSVCTDEAMFYSPLRMTMPDAEISADRCPMWTDWPDSKGGHRSKSKKRTPVLAQASKEAKVGGDFQHPFTYKQPSAAGLVELVAAEGFLFARKFASNASVSGTGKHKQSLDEFLIQHLKPRN